MLTDSGKEIYEITIDALGQNVLEATAFVEEKLENAGAGMKTIAQCNICIDEIFSNISKFAYPDATGSIVLRFWREGDDAFIQFDDTGVPYNPLELEDPDVSASLVDRKPGGLGIFIVKKTMDGLDYVYSNGHNVLTLRKKLV